MNNELRLIDRINTPEGQVLILVYREMWVLAYPDDIDITDGEQIDAHHPVYAFPQDAQLRPREELSLAGTLRGYDILLHTIHDKKSPYLTPAYLLNEIFGESPPEMNNTDIIDLTTFRKH